MHRSDLAVFILLTAGTGAFAQSPVPSMAPASDARAAAVADRVMNALGGQEAWDGTRFLRFGFGSERDGKFVGRTHTWDKWTGRYRVEGERDGARFIILMNVNTREGSAWRDGKKVEGAELKTQLERGYGMWVNDTYWLLMPYKMKDPGVILTSAGEEKGANGVLYDKVKLTFDNVGLTPRGCVLGVGQPRHRPGRPLGLRAQGRVRAANHLYLDGLEEVRRHHARR